MTYPLAEGLFYYLPRQDVTGILQAMARWFDRSQLVFDMAPEKFTKGLWQRLIYPEFKVWGIDVSFVFGINNPRDFEFYGNGFKVNGDVKGNVGPIITVSINTAQHAAESDPHSRNRRTGSPRSANMLDPKVHGVKHASRGRAHRRSSLPRFATITAR